MDWWAWGYTGAPFELWGPAHLVVLAALAVLNLSFWAWRARYAANQMAFRRALAVILLVNEAGWHIWHLSNGQWSIQEMLPFHLCSVMIYTSAWMLWRSSHSIYEYVYFLGIGGALQAALTPDLGLYGFPHFRFFQTFISHGGIVSAAVFMTIVAGFRPTVDSIKRVLIGSNLYMLAVTALNFIIGSNYMFTAHKPLTPSLLDLLGPWPWYILATEGIAVAVIALLYLPFWLHDRRKI